MKPLWHPLDAEHRYIGAQVVVHCRHNGAVRQHFARFGKTGHLARGMDTAVRSPGQIDRNLLAKYCSGGGLEFPLNGALSGLPL